MPARRRAWGLAVPLAGTLAALASASPASASAATNSLGCRASVARVSLLSTTLTEPYVANRPETPCATDGAGLGSGTALDLGALGGSLGATSLTVGPASATTTSVVDATDLGATSTVSVRAASLGVISIAGPARATASYACVNGAAQATASSTLTAIQIGSTTYGVPAGGRTISLGALGSVTANENTVTATSDTERLLDVQLTGLGSIVLGEATVDRPGSNVCAGIAGSGGGGGGGSNGGGGTGDGGATGGGATTGPPVNVAAGPGASPGMIRIVSGPGAATITGTPDVGHTLTVNPGTWTGAQPVTFTYQWLRDGRPISGATRRHYRVGAADVGHYLTAEVTGHNPDGSSTVSTRRVFVPYPPGCPAALGRVTSSGVGRVTLGLTPRQARTAYAKSHRRHLHRYEDFFCFTPNGVRVGYASPRALVGMSRATRRSLAGKVIWVSTANRHYVLDGIRAGTTLKTARRRLHLGRGYRVGRNVWYFGHVGRTELLIKVPHRTVQEIGIVDRRLTRTSSQRRRFLRSFYL